MTAFVAYRSNDKIVRRITTLALGMPLTLMIGYFFGLVFQVIFGVCYAILAVIQIRKFRRMLDDRSVSLRIDHDGILDRSLAERVIPWSVIREARAAKFDDERIVALFFHSPTFFRIGEPGSRPKQRQKDTLRADAMISASLLDCKRDDIALAIRRFRPDVWLCGEMNAN